MLEFLKMMADSDAQASTAQQLSLHQEAIADLYRMVGIFSIIAIVAFVTLCIFHDVQRRKILKRLSDIEDRDR